MVKRGNLEQFKAELSDPGTHLHTVEMTPALKNRLSEITDEVIDLLCKRCKEPHEAYIIVDFIKQSFEEMYDIKGGVFLDKDETGKS